jgi:hypothetical protein
LKEAWDEARERGPTWRQLQEEGLREIESVTRDLTLRAVGAVRSLIPGIDLEFDGGPARHDASRDVVAFAGRALGRQVACAISREALDDHFGTDGLGKEERVQAFLRNRSKIETIARAKYLSDPIEEPHAVLVKTSDMLRFAQSSRF